MKLAIWLYSHSKITLLIALGCGVGVASGFYLGANNLALFLFIPTAVLGVLGSSRWLSRVLFSRSAESTAHLNYHELQERQMYRDHVDHRPSWQSREDAERQLERLGFRPKR
jgi:hypothetical protein